VELYFDRVPRRGRVGVLHARKQYHGGVQGERKGESDD
jgi:hypothetical protein